LTVDIGSGTGLSTAIWKDFSEKVIGIEPTIDMLKEARVQFPDIEFNTGTGYETGLPDESADIVTCSQAFHWMDPFETIDEVARILAPNGVFAVYDCDWPVHWDWEAERAYERLFTEVDSIVDRHPELNTNDVFYPKSEHLNNFRKSGKFRYSTEILFDSIEPCDSQRFLDIALTQGQIQKLIKNNILELDQYLNDFEEKCRKTISSEMNVCYRMVIGIK